jgi:hypothetical protein
MLEVLPARFFLRTRLPPLFEPPRTHSRPSFLHLPQGGEPPDASLQYQTISLRGVKEVVRGHKLRLGYRLVGKTYKSHFDFLCRQCRQALDTRRNGVGRDFSAILRLAIYVMAFLTLDILWPISCLLVTHLCNPATPENGRPNFPAFTIWVKWPAETS